jgi:Family of unknown function (DUF6056)
MERYGHLSISSNKKIIIFLLLLTIVVGPFLILAFFCHPLPGDDFHFAMRALEIGHGGAVLESYLTWTGRYFLCWLLTFRTILHNSTFAYQLLIFFLILSFPVILYFLINLLFKSIDKGHNILLTLIITFIYFYDLPSQDEGLFWFTGAIAYQLPNVLCMFYIIVIFFITDKSSGNKIFNSLLGFIAILLIVMIAGCNEISMAVLLTFNILLSINYFYIKSDKKYIILFLAFVSFITALIVYLAPGNNIRESLFPDRYKFFVTIYMTILGAGYYIFQWFFIALLLTILSIPLFKQYIPLTNRFFKVSPLIAFSFWIVLLIVSFIIPAWATGQMPNPRAINVIFQLFIFGWFYNLIVLINNLKDKDYDIPVPHRIYRIMLIIVIFIITFNPNPLIKNNIKYAYIDIISGKARQYNLQMTEYREKVRKSPIPIHPNLNVKPSSFYQNIEGDSLDIIEIHKYYQMKDTLFK